MDTQPYHLTKDQLATDGAFQLDDINTGIIRWHKANGWVPSVDPVAQPARLIFSQWAWRQVRNIAWHSQPSRDYVMSEQYRLDTPKRRAREKRHAELSKEGLSQFEIAIETGEFPLWPEVSCLINPRLSAPPLTVE